MNSFNPSDYPTFSFEYAELVKNILHDFSKHTGIDFFGYFRGTKKGETSGLFSDPTPSLSWLERGYPVSIGYESSDKANQTFSYIWKDRLPPELMEFTFNTRGLQNGYSLVRRYKEHFEFFVFASSISPHFCTSDYLSMGKDFENFADYFTLTAKDLITQSAKRPLILPSHLRLKNCDEICLSAQRETYSINGVLGKTSLTSQELFSFQLFTKGKSYKEIGKILSISPRTVEKHLSNIKNKLGQHPRDINFLHQSYGKIEISAI